MTPFEADHQSQITAPLFLWFIRLCCCCGQNHQGEIFYPWFHPAVHFEFKTMLHCFAANSDQPALNLNKNGRCVLISYPAASANGWTPQRFQLSRMLIESLVLAFQSASQTLGHMQEHFRVRAINFPIPRNGLGQVRVTFNKIDPACA